MARSRQPGDDDGLHRTDYRPGRIHGKGSVVNSANILAILEDVYLPGYERSVQRLQGGRLRTKAANTPLKQPIAIPLFESLSWAFGIPEGLDTLSKPCSRLSWVKSSSDSDFVEEIRYAANKTKHDLLQIVEPRGFLLMGLPWMGGTGDWKWRPSIEPSDKRDANYASELGGQLVHESLTRLEPMFVDGIRKFSSVAKT